MAMPSFITDPSPSAGNQFFANLPSMPSQGSGNPSGTNVGSFTPDFRRMVNTGGGSGGVSPPVFNPQPFSTGPGGAPSGAGNPYQVPSQGSGNPGSQTMPATYSSNTPGYHQLGPLYPGLSNDLAGYLTSQVGQGVSPYNLSTMLPTGGQTQPGQLTAGLNPLLQQLMQFFQTGQGGQMPGMTTMSNIAGGSFGNIPGGSSLERIAGGNFSGVPGGSALSTIASQGINALPQWQAMVQSMGQNTAQNQANLKEQFAGMGSLAGSPFGTAMSNYMQQTNLDQNALLGNLTQQNILQGQIPAAEQLLGLSTGIGQNLLGASQNAQGQLLAGSQGMGGELQNINQQAIQNQYGEFVRTSPQYNPMIQDQLAMSQMYPQLYKTGSGTGGLGALMGGVPMLGQMGGSIAEGLKGGGGFTDVLSSLAGMFGG
jgi:hypothetical protein